MKNDKKLGLIISIIIALALVYLLSGCQKENECSKCTRITKDILTENTFTYPDTVYSEMSGYVCGDDKDAFYNYDTTYFGFNQDTTILLINHRIVTCYCD